MNHKYSTNASQEYNNNNNNYDDPNQDEYGFQPVSLFFVEGGRYSKRTKRGAARIQLNFILFFYFFILQKGKIE